MRRAPILLGLVLSGCGYDARSSQHVAVAPDPTLYPAPAAGEGRYLPWASGWSYTPPIAVGDPLRITPPARSTPERGPTGSLPTAP